MFALAPAAQCLSGACFRHTGWMKHWVRIPMAMVLLRTGWRSLHFALSGGPKSSGLDQGVPQLAYVLPDRRASINGWICSSVVRRDNVGPWMR